MRLDYDHCLCASGRGSASTTPDPGPPATVSAMSSCVTFGSSSPALTSGAPPNLLGAMHASWEFDGPGRWPESPLIFALLAVSLLTVVMQFTMVSVSLPELTADLHAQLRWSSWVITIFSLGQVIAQPVVDGVAQPSRHRGGAGTSREGA